MDFKTDVIERSYHIPVVVDFWAPWCGPCRILTPVIEQLAEEQKGRWELVKINTEEYEDLAREYNIMSIPNVKMFYRGDVHHEFLGALPKARIQEWLQKVLPSPGLMALDQILNDNPNPTIKDLEELLQKYPESEEIAFVLSQILLWDHPEYASGLVSNFKMSSPFYQKAQHVKEIAEFLTMETKDEELVNVQQLLISTNLNEAIPQTIKLLEKDNNIADGKLAKTAIGIFSLLGNQHPLAKEHRKKLDMVLWK